MKAEQKVANIESNKTLLDLRSLKAKAIANLDYEGAKRIEEQIERERQNFISIALNDECEAFKLQTYQILKAFNTKITDLDTQFYQNQKRIRLHYYTIFQEAKRKQIEELYSIERNLISNRDKEILRQIPEKNELIAKSKSQALIGDYEEALKTKEAINTLTASILKQRFAQCQENYEAERDAALERDYNILSSMNQNLMDELSTLENTYHKNMNEVVQQRETQLISNVNKHSQTIVAAGLAPLIDAIQLLQNHMNDILDSYNIDPITVPIPSSRMSSRMNSRMSSRMMSRLSSRMASRASTRNSVPKTPQ